MSDSPLDQARRRGRRLGIAAYVILLSAFVVTASAEVLHQGFAEQPEDSELSCRDGLRSLIEALHRARRAAASEILGERAAVERFRSGLEPEWSRRAAIGRNCRRDAWARHSLVTIDALRYAEEHAVRYESVDLAPNRRRVRKIEQAIWPKNSTAPVPSSGQIAPEYQAF